MARGLLSRHRHGKSLAALGLLGTSIAAVGIADWPRLAYWANPLGLKLWQFVIFYVAKCGGLALVDSTVAWWLRRHYAKQPLPYRANTGAVGLERLEFIDHFYLAINSVIETVFTSHVIALAVTSAELPWRWTDVTLFNTLPALYLIFALDDMFYAPLHRFLHVPWFYPWVHKHHHRQNLPVRGYLDAGNEHPVEQLLGLSCLWFAIRITACASPESLVVLFVAATLFRATRAGLTGVHAATVLFHFVAYATLALLNHTNYNVKFTFFGFEYFVGSHEMHHRYPQCNMAQYFMMWDKLMGTYKPYYEGRATKD